MYGWASVDHTKCGQNLLKRTQEGIGWDGEGKSQDGESRRRDDRLHAVLEKTQPPWQNSSTKTVWVYIYQTDTHKWTPASTYLPNCSFFFTPFSHHFENHFTCYPYPSLINTLFSIHTQWITHPPPNKHHQIISSASYTSPIHSYNHLPGVNLLKDYMLVTPLLHHLFPETCSHHFVFCLSGSSSSMFTVSSSFFCCFIPIIFLTFQLCPIIPTPSLSLLAPLRQETNSLLPYSVPLYSSPGIKSPPIPKHL